VVGKTGIATPTNPKTSVEVPTMIKVILTKRLLLCFSSFIFTLIGTTIEQIYHA
jgi:hypothetical protein